MSESKGIKNCRDCKQDYENDRELVMYTVNGCPVFYRLCDICMKKRWMNFWGEDYADKFGETL